MSSRRTKSFETKTNTQNSRMRRRTKSFETKTDTQNSRMRRRTRSLNGIRSNRFAMDDSANSNFYVKPDEEEMNPIRLEPINPNSVKSTIVLCVIAHGTDLCNEPLPDFNGKRDANTMIFTLADKNRIALNKSPNSRTHTDYSYKMIRSLYENFTQLRGDSEKKRKQPISKIIKKLEKHINANGSHRIVSEKAYKQLESANKYMKNDYAVSELRKHLDSCNKNRVGKPRVLNIDRLYDISDFDNFAGVHIIDIRNPKNDRQNDHTQIANDLNGTDSAAMTDQKNTKLSNVLSICYEKFGFDNVVVLDFACRTSDAIETCVNGNCCVQTCKNCKESIAEINRGTRMLKRFSKKRLGGKRKLKPKSRIVRKKEII